MTGKYYNQGELDDYSPHADDAALREAFWQESAEAVGINA